jgi:hypothetical protein
MKCMRLSRFESECLKCLKLTRCRGKCGGSGAAARESYLHPRFKASAMLRLQSQDVRGI